MPNFLKIGEFKKNKGQNRRRKTTFLSTLYVFNSIFFRFIKKYSEVAKLVFMADMVLLLHKGVRKKIEGVFNIRKASIL